MNRGVLSALVGAVFFLVLLSALRPPRGAVPAPDFVLPDLSGKVVRMQDLRGKVVLLNIWATWCPPCVQEMPTLEALSHKMAQRDFVLLAVSQDEQPRLVKPWIEERRLTFRVLLDQRGQVGSHYGVTGYPETFIIDRLGRVVHHHVGYRDWAEPGLVAALERLLETGEWKL